MNSNIQGANSSINNGIDNPQSNQNTSIINGSSNGIQGSNGSSSSSINTQPSGSTLYISRSQNNVQTSINKFGTLDIIIIIFLVILIPAVFFASYKMDDKSQH